MRDRLAGTSETAGLEAQVLLANVVGKPRTWVMAHPEAVLSLEQASMLEEKLAELEGGKPLAYVLGEWEFYGFKFTINSAVLIPRPETELLVETALEWLKYRSGQRLGVDVGTGSGCIAITLAANQADLTMLASDVSAEALHLAKQNIRRHGLARQVYPVQADLLPQTSQRFDLICANLPYIPRETLDGLQVGKWEPTMALSGGADGLDLIRRLFEQAPTRIAIGGLMLVEIEAGQGKAAMKLAKRTFPQAQISLLTDLSNRDRLIKIQIR
jgi:release factor glutamine methyltransferase